jgi:4-amino-4-deoxy-L-arabinose transferase-like glycosyltransferase
VAERLGDAAQRGNAARLGYAAEPVDVAQRGFDFAAELFPYARTAALLAIGALVAIVAAAIVLRFADLAHLPGGLYPDEAAEGLDAQRMLHQPGFHPDWFVWFQDDGGREALFAYVVAVVFHFFGETALTLRGAAAGFGVAGVVAVWVLARRWGTWTALAAAAWAAGSLWLVVISRDGMRNTIVPLFGSMALLALLLWLDRPSRRTAALAGGAIALCMLYTYQPLKLLPIVIALWLFWLWRGNPGAFRRLREGFVAFVAAFLVVAAPMIAVAVTNPSNYFGRAAAVSPLNAAVTSDSNLVVHWLRTVAAFGFTGDPNARQDVAGMPLLSTPLALVALLGLVRLWRGRRDPANSLILCSLPVFLVPALIAIEGGSPHFLRLLGMAAPLGVTIGLGAAELVEQVHGRAGAWAARLAVGAVAVGLASTALGSWQAYSTWPVADRYDAYSFPLVALADAAARPNTAVIVGDYSRMDVEFLDYALSPAIFKPGARIPNPAAYGRIVASTYADLVAAVGAEAAAGAQAVAWDPSGKPVVWVLTP